MQSGQGTAVYAIRHGDAAVSIAGIRRRAVQLQALITRALAKMCGGNLIAGDAVVPCSAGEADHIRTGQYRFAALVRLLVFLVGQVRNHRRMTEVFLQRSPSRRQRDVAQLPELCWVEVLLHVPVAHGHPEQAFRSSFCLRRKRGFAGKNATEKRQSDRTASVSKQRPAGDLIGGDIGHGSCLFCFS